MLVTEQNLASVFCADGPELTLKCHYCGKAYTTKHGLQQHLRRYHMAEEACDDQNRSRRFYA